MGGHNQDCFYCQTDKPGSWVRIVRSARDATKSWVCEDSGNVNEEVQAVFCLSIGDRNLPEDCETKGQILLSMIKNRTRIIVGVAVERVGTPATLILPGRNCFIKFIKPISQGLFSNDEGICVDKTPVKPADEAGSMQIETRVLRDSSVDHEEIAALEAAGVWTLAGRTDIGRSTVEAV